MFWIIWSLRTDCDPIMWIRVWMWLSGVHIFTKCNTIQCTVKFSVCMVQRKIGWQAQAFLSSLPSGNKWPASRSGCFKFQGRPPHSATCLTSVWVGSRVGLQHFVLRQGPINLLGVQNLTTLSCHLHCTKLKQFFTVSAEIQ